MQTTRHIEETRWYCTDKTRCTELDKAISSTLYQNSQLSANVAGGHISGLECLRRERQYAEMLKVFRTERAKLWRRGKRIIDEVIDEDGNVVSTNRKIVQPRAVATEVFEAILAEPSVEGKPLVQIRHV
jgi:hypothetical protein